RAGEFLFALLVCQLQRRERSGEVDHRVVARLKLRRRFGLHGLALREIGDLRVSVKLIEELVNAAGLRNQIVERGNALIRRKLLRLVEEVAQSGAIALRFQRFLRPRYALADARPISLLKSLIAIDVRFRTLQRQSIERRGLPEHR